MKRITEWKPRTLGPHPLMPLMAKSFLALIVLLGQSDTALAQGANAAWGGAAAAAYVWMGIYAIVALPALLALGLAFFPRTRPAAVWVSLLAQLPCLWFVLFVFMHSFREEALVIAALPEYISLVALNLGLRGSAPVSKTSKFVLVFLLVSPVAAIAMAGASYWIGRGPSYQGKALAEWVGVRYGVYFQEHTAADPEKAAEAIRQVGPRALPFLLRWLDDEPRGNLAPFGALAPADAALAIPELTRRLNSPVSSRERAESSNSDHVPPRRERAMLALSYLGPASVPAMSAVLSNPELAGLPSTAHSIHNMGTNARPLVPLLVQNAQHPDPKVALSAVSSLGFLKDEPDLIVPALTKSLEHSDAEIRAAATRSLGALGELACPAAVPALIKALNDPDMNQVVPGAAKALGKMNCAPDLVAPALVKSLDQPSADVSSSAGGALLALGEPACPAVGPALVKAIDASNPNVGVYMYWLGKLRCEPDLVVPALTRSFEHSDPQTRRSAVGALDDYGELARPALQALGEALSDRDPGVRMKARGIQHNIEKVSDLDPRDSRTRAEVKRVLDQIATGVTVPPKAGTEAPPQHADVSALVEGLNHPDVDVRTRAAEALTSLGELACPAVPALIIAHYDSRNRVPGTAEAIRDALGAVKCKADELVPALVTLLDHPDVGVRLYTALYLSRYGELARPALPALRKALSDPDSRMRAQARYALRKIAPEAVTNAPSR